MVSESKKTESNYFVSVSFTFGDSLCLLFCLKHEGNTRAGRARSAKASSRVVAQEVALHDRDNWLCRAARVVPFPETSGKSSAAVAVEMRRRTSGAISVYFPHERDDRTHLNLYTAARKKGKKKLKREV